MRDINDIGNDGFSMENEQIGLKGLALLSLKISLKAYFSTYRDIEGTIRFFKMDYKNNPQIKDSIYYSSYCMSCAEAIVHLQHFVELVCKDILREDHRLLADVAINYPVIMHKLLHKESLNPEEEDEVKSIRYSETLKRLCKLIKEKRIKNTDLDFINNNKSFLEKLGKLRDQMWHRGRYVLHYPALDEFFCQYALPFVKKIMTLPNYVGGEGYWKYSNLVCGVDPIDIIIEEFKKDTFDLGKVAFYKELARAAYENPLGHADWDKDDKKLQAERIAQVKYNCDNAAQIRICPICGVNSLLIYEDTEVNGDPNGEDDQEAWEGSYMVKCMSCSFEVARKDFKNPKDYGLDIDDLWYSRKLY